jgi:hypothetical protein
LTGTATIGFIFGGPRVFYDDTKEGGCTITVQADKPRDLQHNEKDGNMKINRNENSIKPNSIN